MATTGTKSSGSDFAGLFELLKHVYEPEVANMVVAESEVEDCFTEQQGFSVTEGPDGKQINMAHVLSAGGGTSAMLEDDYFPTPTVASSKQSSLTIKQIATVVELSGRTLRRVKQGPAAVADWASDVLPLKVERHVFHKDRMLLGTGTGVVCRINDASPGTSDLGIDSAFGIAGLDSAPMLILEDDNLRFGPNANGSSLRSGTAKVAAIDFANAEIDIDALPTSTADNDYVFLGDANVNGSGSRETMGLEGIVDDGTNVATFQGITRSSNPKFNAQIVAADTAQSGAFAGVLSEDLIEYADRIAWERGRGKPSLLLTSRSGRASYWKSLKGDRSINDPAGRYVGGRGPVTMLIDEREIRIKVARKVPTSRAYLLDVSTLKKYRVGPARWDDTTGSMWDRVTDGTGRKDAFWSAFIEELEVGSNAPLKNVKITGLVAA